MNNNPFPFPGLSTAEVLQADKRSVKTNDPFTAGNFWISVKHSISDPVFQLLILAAILYLLLGQTAEALYMIVAVFLVTSISLYEENRSRDALKSLKKLTAKKAKVIRDDAIRFIYPAEIIPGDYLIAEEGTIVAADGKVVHAHDFAVNESMLTGESAAVYKTTESQHDEIYQGTIVISGMAVYVASRTGPDTRMGKISILLNNIVQETSPLEKQIRTFVKRMSIFGGAVFMIVLVINFFKSHLLISSLLKSLTLAMSILPEEIPVAFSTFMALGAWRLMKRNILAKDVKTVEALGAATVICLDKTGTITQNKMELKKIYAWKSDTIFDQDEWNIEKAGELINYAMWASEPVPFDPMEKALHALYSSLTPQDERQLYHMEKEYPLGGRPPMMTHIFTNAAGNRIIAAKGAPERVLAESSLSEKERKKVMQVIAGLADNGYRVLAVASGSMPQTGFPETQNEFDFKLLGLLAFYDPPKPEIALVLSKFYKAGIAVKIITGDNQTTTKSIARQAGFKGAELSIDGEALLKLDDKELKELLPKINIYTRMFPEAKFRIINALKSVGHIVAMTGDGVNDAPALKAAHIGVAMGKRGSEVAHETASLVLLDDDLDKIAEAIAAGRKIFVNLKKAIGYIIAIHIPIILVVTLPLVLNWIYPDIFTPIHVIFLELLMGPTCSLVYENEPMETKAMQLPPRTITANLLTFSELRNSIIQGLTITAGALLVYRLCVILSYDENTVRTLVFLSLISANIFLTLINRSLYSTASFMFNFKNPLMVGIISITLIMVAGIMFIPFLRLLFQFSLPSLWSLLMAVSVGFLSVIWYLPVKKAL